MLVYQVESKLVRDSDPPDTTRASFPSEPDNVALSLMRAVAYDTSLDMASVEVCHTMMPMDSQHPHDKVDDAHSRHNSLSAGSAKSLAIEVEYDSCSGTIAGARAQMPTGAHRDHQFERRSLIAYSPILIDC